jgi:glycosyltransferase involved in cell wall biosynthesis
MLPKVSCILPTGYGQQYVKTAIQCFLDQTYEGELELVVVDNNQEPVKNVLPNDDRIKYVACGQGKSVGYLRNLGISHSSGDVICIWDEDDWHSADRVAEQVKRLQLSGFSTTKRKRATHLSTFTRLVPHIHPMQWEQASASTNLGGRNILTPKLELKTESFPMKRCTGINSIRWMPEPFTWH